MNAIIIIQILKCSFFQFQFSTPDINLFSVCVLQWPPQKVWNFIFGLTSVFLFQFFNNLSLLSARFRPLQFNCRPEISVLLVSRKTLIVLMHESDFCSDNRWDLLCCENDRRKSRRLFFFKISQHATREYRPSAIGWPISSYSNQFGFSLPRRLWCTLKCARVSLGARSGMYLLRVEIYTGVHYTSPVDIWLEINWRPLNSSYW